MLKALFDFVQLSFSFDLCLTRTFLQDFCHEQKGLDEKSLNVEGKKVDRRFFVLRKIISMRFEDIITPRVSLHLFFCALVASSDLSRDTATCPNRFYGYKKAVEMKGGDIP